MADKRLAAVAASAPYDVPATDAVLRSALARSWRRDRVVGRRRLAWRWLLWFCARYVLPAALVVALAMSALFLVQRPDRHASAAPPGIHLKPSVNLHKQERP